MLGSKQIDKIICVVCAEPIGLHTKNDLGRCLFRLQGTMIANIQEQKPKETKFISQGEMNS